MNLKIVFAGLGLVAGSSSALAQFPNASQQVEAYDQHRQLESSPGFDRSTNTVPDLYAGEADDIGPQSVLQLKPRHDIFQATADSQYFYTDNMFLTGNDKTGATVLVDTIEAALEPTPRTVGGGVFAPRVGFEQQWYNYGLNDHSGFQVFDPSQSAYTTVERDAFDFSVQTVYIDGTWCWRNWIFSGGGDFRRLLDSTDYRQFYTEWVPRWGITRTLKLSDTTALSLGYEGTYRITDTALVSPGLHGSSNNRADNSLVVVGSWKLCDHLVLQPYYRLEFSHYTGVHRDDCLNSLGLALYIPLCQHVAMRAFVGYDNLRTDGAYVESYENLTAGGGLNLTIGF